MIEEDLLLPLCHEVILPFYQKRAQLAIRLIKDKIDDDRLHIHKTEGALFLWLWFEGLTIDTSELYRRLKQKGLFVVPGQDKPSRHAESCIRMNYVQSEDDLNKGIEILAQELRLYRE